MNMEAPSSPSLQANDSVSVLKPRSEVVYLTGEEKQEARRAFYESGGMNKLGKIIAALRSMHINILEDNLKALLMGMAKDPLLGPKLTSGSHYDVEKDSGYMRMAQWFAVLLQLKQQAHESEVETKEEVVSAFAALGGKQDCTGTIPAAHVKNIIGAYGIMWDADLLHGILALEKGIEDTVTPDDETYVNFDSLAAFLHNHEQDSFRDAVGKPTVERTEKPEHPASVKHIQPTRGLRTSSKLGAMTLSHRDAKSRRSRTSHFDHKMSAVMKNPNVPLKDISTVSSVSMLDPRSAAGSQRAPRTASSRSNSFVVTRSLPTDATFGSTVQSQPRSEAAQSLVFAHRRDGRPVAHTPPSHPACTTPPVASPTNRTTMKQAEPMASLNQCSGLKDLLKQHSKPGKKTPSKPTRATSPFDRNFTSVSSKQTRNGFELSFCEKCMVFTLGVTFCGDCGRRKVNLVPQMHGNEVPAAHASCGAAASLPSLLHAPRKRTRRSQKKSRSIMTLPWQS